MGCRSSGMDRRKPIADPSACVRVANCLGGNVMTALLPLGVYFAGKISKSDWRHKLIPEIRGHHWDQGPIATGRFRYTGPFFLSCDHGCSHGESTHGANVHTYCSEATTWQMTRRKVVMNNLRSLEASELVFAYITATDCYGTQGEIAYAIAKGIRVVLCFAPDIDPDDFWFWSSLCNAVHKDVGECCLPFLLAASLAEMASEIGQKCQGSKK